MKKEDRKQSNFPPKEWKPHMVIVNLARGQLILCIIGKINYLTDKRMVSMMASISGAELQKPSILIFFSLTSGERQRAHSFGMRPIYTQSKREANKRPKNNEGEGGGEEFSGINGSDLSRFLCREAHYLGTRSHGPPSAGELAGGRGSNFIS